MTWKSEIYNILCSKGGQPITLKQIYEKIKTSPLVTSEHLKAWDGIHQPKYECWVRRCLTDLVRENKIKRIDRGVYQILKEII